MEENDKGVGPAHVPGARKAEEMVGNEGKEAGREDSATGSYRSARDSTSASTDEESITPGSHTMPPA